MAARYSTSSKSVTSRVKAPRMRACSTAAAFASNASRPRSRIPRCAAWMVIAAPRFSWKLASAPYRRQLLAMQLAACSSVIRCPLNIDMSAAPQPAPASRMLPKAWRGEREGGVGGGGGGAAAAAAAAAGRRARTSSCSPMRRGVPSTVSSSSCSRGFSFGKRGDGKGSSSSS